MNQANSVENMLLNGTSINSEELKYLFKITNRKGESLENQLIYKSFGSPEEVLAEVCRHLNVDYMKEIPFNDIPVDLVRNIPINYAKTNEVLPFKLENNVIQVLISNPVNHKALEDMRVLFDCKVRPIVVTSGRIQESINRVYEKITAALDGLDEIDSEDFDESDAVIDLLEAGDDEAPVIRAVNQILFKAVKEKASDIHIEPYERNLMVRFRIDGILYDKHQFAKTHQNAITSRIKVMGNLNIAEKRLPQDGRIPLKVAGKDIDVRLSTVPTAFGERAVMRLQDRSNVVLELEQLGFFPDTLKQMEKLLENTYGIILVTGPTGSGKSTTLYASLQKVNSIDLNIITVEDPVEQRIQGIGQIQVNSKIGLTFGSGLRSILRQDPDIIMIGEIRDLETAEIAINASLTGHLVLSTLHTNDAASAFPRLIDMGCEPFLIATSLLAVAAQRLVRVLCPHCKEVYVPTDAELVSIELTRDKIQGHQIYKSAGCNECNQKGYLGRTTIVELLLITEEVRTLIMQRQDAAQIKKAALANGMFTMRDHGVQKVLAGITTIEEVLANTQLDE